MLAFGRLLLPAQLQSLPAKHLIATLAVSIQEKEGLLATYQPCGLSALTPKLHGRRSPAGGSSMPCLPYMFHKQEQGKQSACKQEVRCSAKAMAPTGPM